MGNGVTRTNSNTRKGWSLNHGNESLPESTRLRYEPCTDCGSKDNLGRYDDGHGYCFGCGYYEHKTNTEESETNGQERTPSQRSDNINSNSDITDSNLFLNGRPEAIHSRYLSESTCKFYNYQIGEYNGDKKCHIASFYDSEGKVVAQKLRFKGKEFKVLGDGKQLGLWGKSLFGSGKKIVITEGEIDCLSVAEVQSCKWPTVSLPNGCSAARKVIAKELEWLLSNFEEIILMFDMDEPGQKAAKECAELFPPGRCKIARLTAKDPNELLKLGKGQEIITAIWGAHEYRPDGIIDGTTTWDIVSSQLSTKDQDYPWEDLNEKLGGMRLGELVVFCAGTGVGKSLYCREIAYHLHKQGESVAFIGLEENVRRSALGFMSIEVNVPLHTTKGQMFSEEKLREAWEKTLGTGRIFLYDHFGSTDVDLICNRIRYLVKSCDVKWIVLDHLSIMVSGVRGGDERRNIDNIMTILASLVSELNVGLFLVSHLKRMEGGGKSHEEGGKTSLSHLRGSGSIGQLSWIVVGVERNQQSKDLQHLSLLRVLKNRHSGAVGESSVLEYNPDTGRLHETDKELRGDSGTSKDRPCDPEDF
jgi:twinkle protein